MKKIEDFIQLHAESHPNKIAVICDDVSITYKELFEKVRLKVEELNGHDIKSRQIVCFKNTQNLDFLLTYFALHIIDAVALPLERDISSDNMQQIRDVYETFLPPDGIADILFTTGTTGKSKGVMVGHDTILADAENLMCSQGFNSENVFLITGPLNHIASLSKIYPVLMTGATLYILQGMKDMNAFFKALDYPCNKIATFLVPASVRILLQFAKDKLERYSDKIEFIETGAAPMPHSDMFELCRILPNSRLYNTYASTETGIISTYNFNDGRCLAGCLGKEMKNSHFFITNNGQIACSGKTIMKGYANDEEATKAILVNNIIYTADNGEIDSNGMLHIMGRNDDVINVGGYKVAPTEVEDVAMSFPDIEDCICISVPSVITTNVLKLIVVTRNNISLPKKDLVMFLKSKLETFKIPLIYEQADKIKRTFNGKLDRKYYRSGV